MGAQGKETVDAAAVVEDGALTVVEATGVSGVRRSSLYKLMGSGRLPFVKVGKRRLIPRNALRELLAGGLVGVAAVRAVRTPRQLTVRLASPDHENRVCDTWRRLAAERSRAKALAAYRDRSPTTGPVAPLPSRRDHMTTRHELNGHELNGHRARRDSRLVSESPEARTQVDPPPEDVSTPDRHLESLERKLQLVRDYVTRVVNHLTPGLFVWGSGGIGKSYTVVRQRDDLGANHQLLNSRVTGWGLICNLERFPCQVTLIEDAESMYRDPRAIGVLRSATDCQRREDDVGPVERWVTWAGDSSARRSKRVLSLADRHLVELDLPGACG